MDSRDTRPPPWRRPVVWLLPWLLTVGLVFAIQAGEPEEIDGGLIPILDPHDFIAQGVVDAVGPLDHLPADLRLAFTYTSHFSPIPVARPDDWLAIHPERGQTVQDYLESYPNRPEPPRDQIYIQPIGALPQSRGPTDAELAEYARRFFGLEVTVLPVISVASLDVTSRYRDGHRQLHAGEVLDQLQTDLPHDTYCLIAVTLEDLYPRDDYNYVFGLARLRSRVGVFSFARYHPSFFGETFEVDRKMVVRRALKVMSHEIGHMFGVEHCIHLHCNMNGSNHLSEVDRAPMHLCPVCHRKLHLALGFSPRERYEGLAELYSEQGLYDAADWASQRAAFLRRAEVDPLSALGDP